MRRYKHKYSLKDYLMMIIIISVCGIGFWLVFLAAMCEGGWC